MKEIGIIMSGNHPLKCLNETKIMTRRTWGLEKVNVEPDRWVKVAPIDPRLLLYEAPSSIWRFEDKDGVFLIVKCPYGGVGDILIMKETLATENRYNHLKPSDIPDTARIFYLASEPYDPFKMGIIRPSIFMPHRFSRGRFKIAEVRVERLQEISMQDLIAEGLEPTPEQFGRPLGKFIDLWDSLNAKRGYGWETNPWVWVISFKLLERKL